jgi:plasmid stabilization system protein ParE
MDETQRTERVVELSKEANLDLSGIYASTASTWGSSQAERYLIFLRETFDLLVAFPGIGSKSDKFGEVRVHIAKLNAKRTSYGHRVFYRESENGIQIVRLLHSSLDYPEQLLD